MPSGVNRARHEALLDALPFDEPAGASFPDVDVAAAVAAGRDPPAIGADGDLLADIDCGLKDHWLVRSISVEDEKAAKTARRRWSGHRC